MFLLDPAMTSDWESAEAEIKRVMDRAGAEVIGLRNWDERKLAYQIGKFQRGLYVLVYFRAAPEKITGIERDVQLSEKSLRVMVIRRESMTDEDVQKVLALEPPKVVRREERSDRGERGERGDRGDRGDRYRDRDDRGDRGDRGERRERSDRSDEYRPRAVAAATAGDSDGPDDDE
jgi:small subunit ribosomal protein S6